MRWYLSELRLICVIYVQISFMKDLVIVSVPLTMSVYPTFILIGNKNRFFFINKMMEQSSVRDTHIVFSRNFQAQCLTVIVRKRVQYRRMVSRRGRRPSWLKSGDVAQA